MEKPAQTNNLHVKEAKKIWKRNEKLAVELAECYYQSILDEYGNEIKKSSKEDLGFNAFTDGIRLGLDVILPMTDEKGRKIIIEKLRCMVSHRKRVEKSSQKEPEEKDDQTFAGWLNEKKG